MLGTEPDIIRDFVVSGQVKLVFWPVINHGNPSVYATLTAHCAGAQNPNFFWALHKYLFENQADLWRADRDYFVNTAVSFGVDQAEFESCYDGPDELAQVMDLDNLRRQRGIFSQPQFDINGLIFVGAQRYDAFAEAINDRLK
ncbi:MAG: thioredoxin domain-containing protein [Chloroflexi bacterium]|nr:thioredoxin domain-containing protein [Chloroflexota bacterium]